MKQERLTSVIGYTTDEHGNQYNVYGIGMLRDKVAKEEPNQILMHRLIECTLAKKLGQYEDIDEKLGIDYVTLAKALDEGFYDHNGKYVDPVLYCGASGWYLCDRDDIYGDRYYLKDYGTTWFLTKGELK